MRYIQYLNENRGKSLSEEEAIQLLKDNCSLAIKEYYKDNSIIRGVHTKIPYRYINPKKESPRKSANTQNYYTLLIDNSPKWKDYPKRSQSLICATSKWSSYGYNYNVFPYDGSKIGVASDSDFWFSFSKTLKNVMVNDFNIQLINLMDNFNILDFDDKSYSEIKKSFDIFDMYAKHNGIPETINKIKRLSIKWIENYKGDLMKTVSDVLDPNKNGFSLKKIGDSLPKDREVWTDGECILVSKILMTDNMKSKLL